MADINEVHFLKQLITEGKCIPFLGAKISSLAGCESDKDIIAKFAEKAYLTQLIADMQMHNTSDQMILEAVRNKINEEEGSYHLFESTILDALTTKHEELMNKFKPFVEKLLFLNSQIKILTTNFDSSLTDCRVFSHENIYFQTNDFTYANFIKPTPAVFHLHDRVSGSGVDRLVYQPDMYTKRYSDPGFSAFLNSTFQQYSILFMGYSLKDVSLLNIFKGLKKYGGHELKEHYAILSEESINESKITAREYYDLFNIRIVNYGLRSTFENSLMGWLSASPTVSEGEDVGRLG